MLKATSPEDDHHSEEIPEAGPDHRDVRFQRVRVDHRGDSIRGVVKSVYKFEPEGYEQCDSQ